MDAGVGITVSSAAFVMSQPIPLKHAGGGDNLSPPLAWGPLPTGTQSLAVLCDDPDAPLGDWVHWVLFDLPPGTLKLDPGLPAKPTLPSGAKQGLNSYDRHGYAGPWPPPGKPHRYFFKVYALNVKLALPSSAHKADVLKAMQGHILAQGQLYGTFKR